MAKVTTMKSFGKKKRSKAKMLANFKKSATTETATGQDLLAADAVSPSAGTSACSSNAAVVDNAAGEVDNLSTESETPNLITNLSTSSKKLSRWSKTSLSVDDDTSSSCDDISISFRLSALNSFVSKMLCPECASNGMTVQSKPVKVSGLYRKYVAVCGVCKYSLDLETERKAERVSSSRLTVLACKETGVTYEQLDRLYEITNHVSLSRGKFYSLSGELFADCKKAVGEHFSSISSLIRGLYSDFEGRVIGENDVFDVTVV